MIEHENAEAFLRQSVDKQIEIEYAGGVITNEELFTESMTLTESLCSQSTLTFGACETGSIEFKIANVVTPLANQQITVRMYVDGQRNMPFLIGKYKVYSDKLTADRKWRNIVAYDAMYDILSAEVSEWYNTVLPNKNSTVTMRAFRKSFLAYLGVEEAEPEAELANDGMIVEKTIEPSEISGKDVITAICEINGCFGHIDREGKFRYVYLTQNIRGLWPAKDLYPADDLYPKTPKSAKIGADGTYISCQYEDYLVKEINKLQIRKEENDIGVVINDEGDNAYIVEDNFLIYGKSASALQEIGKNLFSKITGISYRPFSASLQGNPCFEVGDAVRLNTRYDIVESYILVRTLKGIQALRDSFSSAGTEYYSQTVNSYSRDIVQLRGKTNTLTRNVEETRSTITDVDARLTSEIQQNAGEIALRVRKDSIISEINISPEAITIQAQRIDLVGLVNAQELVSKFATISTLNAEKAALENLIATKATIDSLNSVNANLTNLIAQKATIDDLNALSARVGTIEANYISASKVKAEYMEVKNWTSAGKIKADRIDVKQLAAEFAQIQNLELGTVWINGLNLNGYFTFNGNPVVWKTISIGERTINYLGSVAD